MNEKKANVKPSSAQGGGGVIGASSNSNTEESNASRPAVASGSSGSESHTSHAFGSEQSISHYHHQQQIQQQSSPAIPNQSNYSNKEDTYGQPSAIGTTSFGRYQHGDTNIDSYRYTHSNMQSICSKSQSTSSTSIGSISSPNRSQTQRYIPSQPPPVPTPTLNSLLQSHPPPSQHRYSNTYDQQQPPPPQVSQLSQQQPQQHPPSHQQYAGQGGWVPTPPRPYSPQLGSSQSYRTPAASSSSRGQSPYPPSHNQGSASYSNPPQPPVSLSNQVSNASGTSQYSPYPQRYPTPPASGPNQRTSFSSHQFPESNRSWSSGSSPGGSPGSSGNPLPAASPHQTQHTAATPHSPGHAPSPSPQPSHASPSPHQELLGQNSNDSSSGGGVSGMASGPPGTPNPNQTMRPSPSPTGSSGSRSMSPAVAQTVPLPRTTSSQSQSGISTLTTQAGFVSPHNASQQQSQASSNSQISLTNSQQSSSGQNQAASQLTPQSHNVSNVTTPPGYQTQPSGISHMHSYNKMASNSGQTSTSGLQLMTSYHPPTQPQQYSPGNYSARPQFSNNYNASTTQQSSGTAQYVGRPMLNHSTNSHSPFPPYQQSWAPPSSQNHASGVIGNLIQTKSGNLTSLQPNIGTSPRPLNYLKQHLQHKGNYVGGGSPTQSQSFGNGSSIHLPMGPPHHMGPSHGTTSMGPPTSTPLNANNVSGVVCGSGGPVSPKANEGVSSLADQNIMSQDNGINSSGSSTGSSHAVTSVITTGPDGASLDEASQQSTLSNASAASGEESLCVTPKTRKSDPYSQNQLTQPSTSPGVHPHPDDFDINSPSNWSRTPASPVFNNQGPAHDYRISTKKSDSLCKLYDMDENPERRGWLDKLLNFMDERRTPITACPTISKQPLDLYRLYIYVKERGGFVEVTKSKTWKDIAGLLGIGASSSAAYTLRKHYTKNLLAFECHFDRGDIDPLPIIQQVEAGSKKKSTKAASIPSPGSSNSQDSFPAPATTNTSIDGYTTYSSGYPTNTQTEYNAGAQMSRPAVQGNTQTTHSASPYTSQPIYSQFGDQYNNAGPSVQFSQGQSQFPSQNRTIYPSFGQEGENSPNSSNTYGPYGNRTFSQQAPGTVQCSTSAANTTTVGPAAAGQVANAYPVSNIQQQDYYRASDSGPQPRRHPDFAKDSQAFPGYNPRPQIYGGWQGSPAQYRGQYPSPGASQPWCNAGRVGGTLQQQQQQQQTTAQWDQHRYPTQSQQTYQQQPQQWANVNNPQSNPGSPLRASQQRMQAANTGAPGTSPNISGTSNTTCNSGTISAAAGVTASGIKSSFSMPPPQLNSGPGSAGVSCITQSPVGSLGGNSKSAITPPSSGVVSSSGVNFSQALPLKKDVVFPLDSVEATTPILYRRKRLCKTDVCPVDPWRIFMAMRSGLLAESTWALDLLNILLYDDTTVQYFGLAHLPGLLSLLLEHFQKNLSEMFEAKNVNEDHNTMEKKCYNHKEISSVSEEESFVDLGQVTRPINLDEKVVLLSNTPNFSLLSRKSLPVRIQNSENDIFVTEQKKIWDIESGNTCQLTVPIDDNPWIFNYSEYDSRYGIIDVFKSEILDIPFTKNLKNSSSKTDQSGIDQDERQMNSCNRKRGFYPLNSSNNASDNKSEGQNNMRTILAKKIKLQYCLRARSQVIDESVDSNMKHLNSEENIDSDCREIDMEIEPKLTNGVSHDVCSGSNIINRSLKPLANSEVVFPNQSEKEFYFNSKITIRDPALVLHRRQLSSYEDECYTKDDASLYLVNERQDSLARRCICLSNIFRNLTFVPGNETILAKSSCFLTLLGRLLLLNHEHLLRGPKTRNYDREEDTNFSDSCSSLQGEKEWWWDYLIAIRENMLVAVANIAGHLELSRYEEIITRPVLDGLLHWAVCPSAHGQDSFPTCSQNSLLSPQRLALEALCKLCVTDANVDLVIATPPHSRLEKLCAVLTRHLCRNEDQVLREFSVNLLHYLAAADSAMARTVALQSPCISYLVAFIEQAEQTALGVANQHGINYLRENPDSMGTSLDMLRRAAGTLLHLSKHPDNRSLFMQQEPRLLGLVMSHILDQQVALIISRVLFQISRSPTAPLEYRLQQRQNYHNQNQNTRTDYIKICSSTNESTKNIGSPNDSSSSSSGALIESFGGSCVVPKLPTIKVHASAEVSNNSAYPREINFLSGSAVNIDHIRNSTSSSNNMPNRKSVLHNDSSEEVLPSTAILNDISNSSNSSNSCASSISSRFSANLNSNNNYNSSGGEHSTTFVSSAVATTSNSLDDVISNIDDNIGENTESKKETKSITEITLTENKSNTNNNSSLTTPKTTQSVVA